MTTANLQDRVAASEAEVARLKTEVKQQANPPKPWTDQIAGIFAGDPAFEEAMRLGRQYRESLRPKHKEGR